MNKQQLKGYKHAQKQMNNKSYGIAGIVLGIIGMIIMFGLLTLGNSSERIYGLLVGIQSTIIFGAGIISLTIASKN